MTYTQNGTLRRFPDVAAGDPPVRSSKRYTYLRDLYSEREMTTAERDALIAKQFATFIRQNGKGMNDTTRKYKNAVWEVHVQVAALTDCQLAS